MALSDNIRNLYYDLKRRPQDYCISEIVDELENFENEAVDLENEKLELEERLEQYEEEE